MMMFAWIVLFVAVVMTLAFQRASLSVWTIGIGVFLVFCSYLSAFHPFTLTLFWIIYLGLFGLLNIRPLRQHLLSRAIFSFYRQVMPALSDTEREALNAGSVGWEAELFAGMPNWNKLQKIPLSTLSAEERAFMDGPVEEFCSRVNAWEMHHSMNIPTELLDFLRKNGFLGMIIPKQYGGLEFSHFAHSQVITKLASASCAAAILTSVPNSLGPAELLLRYGTESQKNYYLPRLAKGDDVPCFALTSPVAGSDAGAIEDNGVVCEAEFEGKKQLCIRLNWNKRYITLAPVSTLLGLAFKLYDPDHLLGQQESLGITCALIPTHLPNVEIGRRHVPLHSPFPNGPTQGHDVIVPMDAIIGGVKMAGHGWRMLMECLAAGRGISLPSMATGGSRAAALATGAYARIRQQFHMPIGRFGGVEEALTRIATNIYAMESTRNFTVSTLDQGARPAVASAIAKYHTTEMARRTVIDAMDISGGKGICMGPKNYLAQGYIELPVSITVEGANILTRSMIIFGQGAVRCHPYVLPEMLAASNEDRTAGLKAFDKAIFGHIGFMISNKVRAFVLAVSNGRLAAAPKGPLKRYYQQFSRFSAALAYMADMAMVTMGGELKRAEKLSGRYGDLLSNLYIGSCVLKFHEAGKYSEAELPVIKWICEDLLFKMQTELDGILSNFPSKLMGKLFRYGVIFPCGRYLSPPSDHLGAKVAKLMLEPGAFRDRLSTDLYLTPNDNNPAAKMSAILKQIIAVEPIEKKLAAARRDYPSHSKTREEWIETALAHHVISAEEAKLINDAYIAKMDMINVDDFAAADFQ
ncbi:MAG: acyl-CoA dehydrogenase [Gammaproteobacteria bacterium]|nr:acyl-CoA dehydrogenase [Gammaproteobacteria bacterium]